MIRVLFVCAGNICRSPMAEAVFAQQVRQANLSAQISTDSAGTGNWHIGEPADPRTLAVLEREQIPYQGRARQFQREDALAFTYILAMDNENLANIDYRLNRLQHPAEVRLFLGYANAAGLTSETEVPDPYYNNQFDRVYTLVELGSRALLAHIQQQHGL